MNPFKKLLNWWRVRTGEEGAPMEGDAPAWLISLVVHLSLLVLLVACLTELPAPAPVVELTAVPLEENFVPPPEYATSDLETPDIGANSANGKLMAEAIGVSPSEVTSLASMSMSGSASTSESGSTATSLSPSELGTLPMGPLLTGLDQLSGDQSNLMSVQGATGIGTTGASGAVDRISLEILKSLEQDKTLVVWFFDQSLSLSGQRESIYKRLDRIYEELGVAQASGHAAFVKHEDKPLLSSVVAFGKDIRVLTPQPTDQVAEIKAAVAGIQNDDSGVERTFEAICTVAESCKKYRYYDSNKYKRKIIFVIFTDETGDDAEVKGARGTDMLDRAVQLSRSYGIRNFVVGIPSPFGRKDVEVKWVDPDPRFNQDAQWTTVTQGPETLRPERLKIAFTGRPHHEESLDSGFGPFNLARLTAGTEGLYIAVHPNREPGRPVSRAQTSHLSSYIKYFFDSKVMQKYQPDYVSVADYQRKLQGNRAKWALVEASSATWISPITNPQLRFRRRDEADLARQLSEAQQQAAKLEPKVSKLVNTLSQGKSDRDSLREKRWQAGYDLALGQALALKVRTTGYNAMLAKAKRGMKFENPKNDTWDLVSSNEVGGGSALEKEAKQAVFYLNRVVEDHPNTPWAMLAAQELADPMGWQWRETFTNVNPPRVAQPNNNNNNNRPMPRDDQRKVIPPKPTRQPPKL